MTAPETSRQSRAGTTPDRAGGVETPPDRRPGAGTTPDGPRGAGTAPDRIAVLAMWVAFVAWTVLFAWVHRHHLAGAWHYFMTGARLLRSDDAPGGLYLYAHHPELQIGPLAFVAALPMTWLPAQVGRVLAVVVMTALGPLALALVIRLIPAGDPRRRLTRVVPAGLLLLTVWAELGSKTGHLDDVLALLLALLAMHAVSRRRPVLAALLLAGSADCKPWALAFVAMLLALPRADWWRAGIVWVGGVLVAWLPFVLVDPATVHALADFVLPNSPASALRAIGIMSPHTPPWDRPAQILLGAGLGVVAVRRGAWPAVLVVALAVRVLLDPSVFTYYTAGLLLGAVVLDLVVSQWRLPWTTLGGFVLVYLPRYVDGPLGLHPATSGVMRATYCLSVLALVVFGRLGHPRPDTSSPDAPAPWTGARRTSTRAPAARR